MLGAHAQVAGKDEQRLFVLVLRDQQSLLVIRKLYLRAQHIHACRGPSIVLVFRQLVQNIRVGHPGLGSIGTRRGRLGVEVEAGNGTDDEIARILVIHFAGIKGVFAGLPPAITLKIDDVLVRIKTKIVIGKRSNNRREARSRDPESAQGAVLEVGVALHAHPRKQRSRQAAYARALGFLDSGVGDEHVEVGLQRLLNGIT